MTEYGAPPPVAASPAAPATHPLPMAPPVPSQRPVSGVRPEFGMPPLAGGPTGATPPGAHSPTGPVRAMARVGAEAPTPAGKATLLPRRRPGHLGPIHVMQLLVTEVAILAVMLAARRHLVIAIGAAVLGLALLVVTLARRQGRWWLERMVMARQFRQRRASRPVPGQRDPRLAALQWLAPGLTVAELGAPDGSHIGVARDDAGWFAVAAVPSTAAMRDDPRAGLPLDALVAALIEAEAPGAAIQVVTHTVPSSPPSDPASQSYLDLVHQFGPVPIPVDRITWLAVRLDARALAEAGADQGDEADATATIVAALLRRLVKSLRRTGVTATALDREGLLGALARSCDLAPTPTGAPVTPREEWQAWRSGRLAHRCFWVRDWPTITEVAAALDALAAQPAAASSLALIAVPTDDDVDIRCLLRIAAAPELLPQASAGLLRAAQHSRVRLFPLDGEQGPAIYASAPTGGGPR